MTTFSDARLVTLGVLRALAPAEASYGTKDPDDSPEGETPAMPYAAVKLDFTSVQYPVSALVSVRILVWDASEHTAERRAWRLHAALVDYPGDSDVGSFRPELGPRPATDPDTGRPFASFTVRARLRPQP